MIILCLLEHKYGRALLDDDPEDVPLGADTAIQSQEVLRGRFKFLVRLRRGENKFAFSLIGLATASTYCLSAFREATRPTKVLKLVYLVPSDGDGDFQAPTDIGNSTAEATQRIGLAAELIQCFIG